MTTAEQVWRAALADLRLGMAPETYDGLLGGSRALALSGRLLTVEVRNERALAWLEAAWRERVAQAVGRQEGADAVEAVMFLTPQWTAAESAAQVEQVEPVREEPGEDEGPILEAVREERTTVALGGTTLTHTDFYIKLKTAFRRRALRELKGAPLSVFLCLALHVDRDGVAYPGIMTVMRETGYSRGVVCNALGTLVDLGLCSKRATFRGNDEYIVNGYAWFGQEPAPCLWEEK